VAPVITKKSVFGGAVIFLVLAPLLWPDSGPAPDVCFSAGSETVDVENAAADLSRWPFGNLEKMFAIDAEKSSRMALLRREIRKGFPVPKAWRPILEKPDNKYGLGRLSTVNALINTTRYVTEKVDQWKPPAVFLAEGGDCDGYAAAKYILLRHLGFPAKDLRITGVRIRKNNSLHAVLVARTGSGKFKNYVLDNIGNYVRSALYTDKYVPLISLNEKGVWIHDPRGQAIAERFANPPLP
jgi:predicted transglutaminase-like cysteine proteinase